MAEFAKQKKIFLLLRSHEPMTADTLEAAVQRQFIEPLTAPSHSRGIIRVVYNRVSTNGLRPATNGGQHDWSAVVELYVDDAGAIAGLLAHPVLAKPDRTTFAEMIAFPVSEKFVFGSIDQHLPVKLFNFYKAGDRQHSHDRWAAHADFGKSNNVDSKMPKYSQNATLPEFHARGARYDYDGASISWFPSEEDVFFIFKNSAFMAQSDADGLEMTIHVEDVVDLLVDEKTLFAR